LTLVTILTLGVATIFYNELRDVVQYPNLVHWNIPTFLHVLIFSLLTAGISGQRRGSRCFIPTLWVVLNITVEVLQRLAVPPFFGTFDWFDILAAVLGGVIAFTVLPLTTSRRFRVGSFVTVTAFGVSILTATSEAKKYKNAPTHSRQQEPTVIGEGVPFFPTYDYNHEPIYMTYEDLRQSFAVEKPRPLEVAGKMLVIGTNLYVSEPNSGVHVFDNTDPTVPKAVHFLVIPGNVDLAAKDGVVYADSFVDLVAIDFSGDEPKEIDRVEGTFVWNPYQALKDSNIRFLPEFLDEERGVIVGSKPKNESTNKGDKDDQ
jgi:hypothetical protein